MTRDCSLARYSPFDRALDVAAPRRFRQAQIAWVLLAGFLLAGGGAPTQSAAQDSAPSTDLPDWVERQDEWRGFTRWHFKVGERAAYVVLPPEPMVGRPWIWRARFPDFHAEADEQLIRAGFHLVYLDVAGWFGAPRAIDDADACYLFVREALDLHPQMALEGVSRGGLFVYHFLLRYPERVACLYADTPVLDFRSWPAGWGASAGAEREWQQCLERWQLTEDEARTFSMGILDQAERIARTGIPLLHIVSENDRVVPPAENTDRLAEQLHHWGGHLEQLRVAEGTEASQGHHFTHPDVERVVTFIRRHAGDGRLPESRRPPRHSNLRHANLIVFLVDDLGWQDTSVPFADEMTAWNQRYRTPNMERLAAQGMLWTEAYASCVCSPSRVSLLTGQNAARHRVTNWTLRPNATNDAPHPRLDFPDWNVNGLSPRPGTPRTVVTEPLPAHLQKLGYRTIHVGKAHWGALETPGADPLNLGFDVNIGGHAAGGPGSYLGTQDFSGAWRGADRVWDVPGLEAYHGKDVFLTDALTREALRELDQAVAREQPFFLHLAHYAVHVPFAADGRYIQRYRDAGLDETEAMYAALVEGFDASLGQVLDRLEHHGISEDTLVVFLSDNGGLSAQGRGGTPHRHNWPLASGKGSAREGGVRIPLIVSWPGTIAPGTRCAQPTLIEDWFPTLLEIGGASLSAEQLDVLDGRSLWPFLLDAQWPAEDRRLIWHFPNHWGPQGPGIGPSSSLRRGPWKLTYRHDSQQLELFQLEQDLSEQHNVVSDHPELTASLAAELTEILHRRGAQWPRDRRSGEAVPAPLDASADTSAGSSR